MLRALPAIAALCAACASDAVFTCSSSGQCVHAGQPGTCEASRYCSFVDPGCSSGRRYGSYASPALADHCVDTGGGLPDGGPGTIDAAPGPDARPSAQVKLDAVADTQLSSAQMTANFGAASELRSDGDAGRVALMRWDLASIPPGSTVITATLSLSTSGTGALTQGTTQIFAVLEDWTEGTANGSAGVANWTMRTSAAAWTAAGAGAASHAATPMAEFSPSSASTRYDVALPAAGVQSWLDTPSSNHGVAFVDHNAGTASLGISSREGSPPRRPSLTVTYYLP